jgi:Cys-rich repeat protein
MLRRFDKAGSGNERRLPAVLYMVAVGIPMTLSLVLACSTEFRFEANDAITNDAALETSALKPQACRQGLGCGLSSLRCSDEQECVECSGDSDCNDRPSGPKCRMDIFRCVQCLANSDCKTGFICEASTRACVELCGVEGSACKTPATLCEDGLCRSCDMNTDCTKGANRICNRGSGQCVECLNDANCGSGRPLCATQLGACVECIRSVDCAASTPLSVCNPDTNRCEVP